MATAKTPAAAPAAAPATVQPPAAPVQATPATKAALAKTAPPAKKAAPAKKGTTAKKATAAKKAVAARKPAAKPAATKAPATKTPAVDAAKPPVARTVPPKVLALPKTDKPKKPKLVRDSFTIPKNEYLVLDELKARAARLGHPAKKSEVLRAGLKALAVMSDSAFSACLHSVPTVKTGRPAKN